MRDFDRVCDGDGKYHLFCDLDPEALQAELAQPANAAPLGGRLIGLKANIACKGAHFSAGLPHRASWRAQTDAHITTQLRNAGARVLPGLNMDAAALGGTTENPHFGATRNPASPQHSAGGSSGGSAAAVAAGLVDVAIGTDTLGSIRIPASWCGVHGLKPGFGALGRSGIVPLAPSLDCVGPITRVAADLLVSLRAMAGEDLVDEDWCAPPKGWLNGDAPRDVATLRIGVRRDDTVTCEPAVQQAMARATAALADAGATIVPVAMPGWSPAALRKAAFLVTECEGAVVFADALAQDTVLPASVQALMGYGARAGSAKLVAALAEMRKAKAQLMRSFQQIDVLITPTTPQRAIRLGTPAPANQADYTALANVAGVPALAAPVPMVDDALPASVQLMGPAWSERRLIGLACVLETVFAQS
ncbi:MAG: amidase [Sedimentitalea sp.]